MEQFMFFLSTSLAFFVAILAWHRGMAKFGLNLMRVILIEIILFTICTGFYGEKIDFYSLVIFATTLVAVGYYTIQKK